MVKKEDIIEDAESYVTDTINYVSRKFEESEEFRLQVMFMVTFILSIITLRMLSTGRLQSLKGEHTLSMSALNEANLFKEVFLSYLNAALLEPVLAIAGMQEVVGEELIINIFTLGSICWWIWLVTDAFDFTDVMQTFKYTEFQQEADEKPTQKEKDEYSWLRLKTTERMVKSERQSLVGTLKKDIALWFMLACIAAAWLPGIVDHRDVMHAYVVVVLWTFLHHACRRATVWSAG